MQREFGSIEEASIREQDSTAISTLIYQKGLYETLFIWEALLVPENLREGTGASGSAVY